MKIVPIGEFKAQLSDLLKEVVAGKEIGISYGRKRVVVAILAPFPKLQGKKRRLGLLDKKKGFKIHKDFEISDKEFLEL